jgi:hypothetical protein
MTQTFNLNTRTAKIQTDDTGLEFRCEGNAVYHPATYRLETRPPYEITATNENGLTYHLFAIVNVKIKDKSEHIDHYRIFESPDYWEMIGFIAQQTYINMIDWEIPETSQPNRWEWK